MRILKAQLLLSVLASLCLAGGVTIGNGGTGLICAKDSVSTKIRVQMLEYYELTLTGASLKLNSNLSDYKDIIKENLARWMPVAPQRVKQYQSWLSTFEQESLFISDSYFPPINDTGTIAIPFNCELQTLAFQKNEEDLFPGVKRYTINKDYWDLMEPVQKAGLVMHELIYREGITSGHKTSFPTRYFNSYLASAEPNPIDYAYIASQLPLSMVEYGGGITLWSTFLDSSGNLTKNLCVQKTGYLENCYIYEISGNVNLPKLTIQFHKKPKDFNLGNITLRENNLSIRISHPVLIKYLRFTGSKKEYEFTDSSKPISEIKIDFDNDQIVIN